MLLIGFLMFSISSWFSFGKLYFSSICQFSPKLSKLVQHEPFTSRERAVKEGLDILSETKVLEFEENRRYVRDTDQGAELKAQIDDLYQLLEAYRNGSIRS